MERKAREKEGGREMSEDPHKSYYAIVPANVRYDDRITPNAKLLYGEITALCNEKGYCWASNTYFSKLYKVSKQSISTWINQLIKYGYITSEIIYKEGTKEILNRYIRILVYPIKENLNTPIQENLKDNNTLLNTTVNNTSNKYCPNSNEFRLSSYLYGWIKKNNSKAKEPNLQTWSKTFDKILRIDKRPVEEVKEVIKWSQEDDFWFKNILSPDKLRKQYDRLLLQMKDRPNKPTEKKTSGYIDTNNKRGYDMNDLEKKLLRWEDQYK